jgi:hypothetical protein
MSTLPAAISHFVERTAAITRTGLAFNPDGFDAERYEELLREAAAMSAALNGAGRSIQSFEDSRPPARDRLGGIINCRGETANRSTLAR